jgi:hypothetical protein
LITLRSASIIAVTASSVVDPVYPHRLIATEPMDAHVCYRHFRHVFPPDKSGQNNSCASNSYRSNKECTMTNPTDNAAQMPEPRFKLGQSVAVSSSCKFYADWARSCEGLKISGVFYDRNGEIRYNTSQPGESDTTDWTEEDLSPLSPPPVVAKNAHTDDDGWIQWRGGDCLVEPDTKVEVRFYDGLTNGPWAASYCRWHWNSNGLDADITAYRVVEPARETIGLSDAMYSLGPVEPVFNRSNSTPLDHLVAVEAALKQYSVVTIGAWDYGVRAKIALRSLAALRAQMQPVDGLAEAFVDLIDDHRTVEDANTIDAAARAYLKLTQPATAQVETSGYFQVDAQDTGEGV